LRFMASPPRKPHLRHLFSSVLLGPQSTHKKSPEARDALHLHPWRCITSCKSRQAEKGAKNKWLTGNCLHGVCTVHGGEWVGGFVLDQPAPMAGFEHRGGI
jgi:hypothetical protein